MESSRAPIDRLNPRLRLRFQVQVKAQIALGPGKADLLELIERTGSISAAATRMEMSYMRAWTLVKTMNCCFQEPLVVAVRGGQKRGGAQLSETGRKALGLYRQLEEEAVRATANTWKKLRMLVPE